MPPTTADEFAQGTWKKLDADSLTWYTYSDQAYLNAGVDKSSGADDFGSDDLVYTSNLHFIAQAENGATTAYRRIELSENVDLGVGHVQFSLGEGATSATYDIGQSSSNRYLSSAGFVVDKGVTLNNYFTYEKGRELRRVGEGTMNMMGTGNNDVLLNIGGAGLTYLNRSGGYASYSALVNNKAVLKLADVGQVHNNVTLGAGGGVLDFNGNDYRWTSGGAHAQGSDGREYFGLTVYEGLNRVESSAIANLAAGTTTTLTIERADNFEFAGAFRDGSTYTGSGSVEQDSRYTMMPSLLIGQYQQFTEADRQASSSTLRVIYNGGATMDMTGVYTLLTGNSGLEVASGKVSLHGTNTIHAIGSDNGNDKTRYENAKDWHYAMAETAVSVGQGGCFELGDHALLIGNVVVQSGGSLVMKQAVNERYEFVEGWYKAEDTYALADYYGLKGNVSLAEGASMSIAFDEGVATQLHYGGNISGSGSLSIDAGAGSVILSGQNTVSGEKTVQSGHVRLAAGAEGDTSEHLWLIEANGSLALEGAHTAADYRRLVDEASTGVLALVNDLTESTGLSGLTIGAAAGETAHYGQAATALQASNGQWTLGGGGGTLVVDFLLQGEGNKLVLGRENATGTVVLANAGNNFGGGIELRGELVLGYTSAEALGNNVLSIGYDKTLAALSGATFAADKVHAASSGVFAVETSAQTIDLSRHRELSLAAMGQSTFSGSLTVAEDAAYRLGGAGALTLQTQLTGNHGILVDGHGHQGSSVTFAVASADTGAVIVQGYDAAKAAEGDVTLSFATDNALATASSITLRNNAGVNLNGSNQQFNNLTSDAGSLIVDDKGGNTLTLHQTTASTLAGSIQAAATAVVKTGSGTLTLAGSNLWQGLEIQEGIVKVSDAKALGFRETGSQGIDVTINKGAMLHVTKGMSFSNTLHVAGRGVDEQSVALQVDGHLDNSKGSLCVSDDAAISGQFTFKQVDLLGNTLTVQGSSSSLKAASFTKGALNLTQGASLNLAGFNGGAGVAVTLDNATIRVSKGRFDGSLSIGPGGATIEYPWNDSSKEAFTQSGFISGTSAGSLLKLVGHMHTMTLSGGAEFAGRVEVGNGLTLNITKDASFGALVNEANSGDLSRVVVDAATLELTGSGSNFGTNGNEGNIELTNGGVLQLSGLANGASMGSLGKLDLGSDGKLLLSSLAGYGSNALMHINTLAGTGELLFNGAEMNDLAAGTYHLLSSGNSLEGLLTLSPSLVGSRREWSLQFANDGCSLDLVVGEGSPAAVTWKGTGTLVTGQANTANITTNLAVDDSTFMALDALTITSDAGAQDTLTLRGTISASTLQYTGAGRVTIAQDNGGSFAEGLGIVIDATGTLALGDTTAISGAIELRQGTLSASNASLNGTEGVRVTGDAHFELTSASHVTAGIDIAKDKSLTVSFASGSMAEKWGGNFDNNLSGEGCLKVDIGSGKELHLNGDQSAFMGSIELLSGTLQLGLRDNGTLVGSELGAGSISVASGATLSLSSLATTVSADIAWAGGSTLHVKDGADKGVAFTLSGTQTLGGALTISAATKRTVQISGGIEGAGSLNFTGASSFILTGNSSYSGGTTLNNSGLTLYAANRNALGTGAIKLQNGTLSWQNVGNGWNGDLAASGIEVSGGALNSNGYDVSYSGAVSGSTGSLTKTGAGTLELSQFSYTGKTHVAEGTLALRLPNDNWIWTANFEGEANTTLRLMSDSRLYLNGSISGGMALQLDGKFGLTGPLSHTGGTTLRSGSLEIGYVGALQSSPLHAHKGTTVSLVMEKTYMVGDSVVDALSFGSGSSVLVGADSAAGHLSFGSLSGTASFLLDVFSAESFDRLSGTLTPGSLLAVELKASELGSYLLVAGDNSSFDTSTISLSGNKNAEHLYLWSNTQQGLTLTIESASLAADSNFWVGGSNGSWDASTTPWHGGNYSADRKTYVLAHADTAIDVAAAVSATTLQTEVDADATLRFSKSGEGSITATTLQKDGEGTLRFEAGSAHSFGSVVVNEGTLSVADGSALGTTNISGNGTFELRGGSIRTDLNVGTMAVKNIRLDGGALTLYSTGQWGTSITGRSVEILGTGSSLSLEKWSNLNASSIVLRDGGTLRTGENGLGNDGGTIYVDGTGVIAVGNTGGGNVAAAISGTGTLKVQDWNAGHWVSINGVVTDDARAASPLALELSQNYVVMNAENSYRGGTTITAGHVIVSKASALGTGSLHMTGGSLTMATTFRNETYSTDLHIGSLSGTAGTIETGANALRINQTQSGTFAGSITGSATITKAGRGELNLTGANLSAKSLVVESGVLNVGSISLSTDSLAMTQAGTALNIDSLTLTADAVTLAYSSAQSNVSIGSLTATGALTLSLADSLESYLTGKMANGLHNILDLGADLSTYAQSLVVTGLGIQAGQYTIGFNAATGHSTLQLRPDSSLAWDANWGITGAPATGEHVSLSASSAFAGQAAYDNGTRIVVGVVGTDAAAPLNLVATTAEGATLSRSAWVELEGGSFGVIAGASSNAAAANITGDIHFVMSGGTANDVVGFTQQTAHASKLTGSTYISVYEGATIHDSVIGGGVMTNGQRINLTGSTNVWIYDVLAAAPASLSGDVIATRYNAVIGGHAHGSGGRTEWSIGGSTHVTVDVSTYSGEAAIFGKSIYGGNVSNGQWGSIAGGTNVTLNANDKVSFSENIVAGSYNDNSEGQVTIDKNSTLTINGGVYGGADKFITGGSLLEGSKSVLSGTASVAINGGSINRDVFGAGVNLVGSSTVGQSAVTIGGTARVADDVAAGGKVESGSITISGNSTLRVNGGSLDGGTGKYLTGGSVVSGGSSTISGTASVILAGGSINQNVYAAGINNSGGKSTVGATRVEIGKDASFGNVTVSGGFGGEGASAGSVGGSRVLALQNGADLSATSASFKAFDAIEVASGTASLNAGAFQTERLAAAQDYDWTGYEKTGAGTLVLSGTAAAPIYSVTIKGGTLKLDSAKAFGNSNTVNTAIHIQSGTLDINGQEGYGASGTTPNALQFGTGTNYHYGQLFFDGAGTMLVKDSAGTSGLGFSSAATHNSVIYSGTGRAEIAANIVSCDQANPTYKIGFKVNSANRGGGVHGADSVG